MVDADKEDFNDGGRRSQANRDKRLARAKRLRADREELDRLRKKPWSSGVDAKQQDQKGKGKGKTKENKRSGRHTSVLFLIFLCEWHGACGALEPGAACQQKIKRAHKCQFCLSPGHRNSDCPKQA